MPKIPLLIFSLALFLIFGSGTGLVTLVPVYLSRLGVQPVSIGYLFSLLYFGMASSSILAGWLADRFGRHKIMSNLAAAGGILASLLMLVGAQSFLLLAIGLFLAWFLAGIHSALISTMVGLQAQENERGRVFGIVGFITGLGPVLSGFLYGKIMDAYGFEALLILNVAIAVLWTILSLYYNAPPPLAAHKDEERHPGLTPLPGSFYLVVFAAILGWLSVNGGKLGTSLVMTRLSFSADDISLTVGVASLTALAMPLLLGWLSDHIGRKPLLLGLNLLGLIGLMLISQGKGLAGFCVASSLLSLYSCFGGLANALVTDIVPPKALGFGLSLINSTSFIAGIFSSALVGLAINTLGPSSPFLIAMVLPLIAFLLLARTGKNPSTVKAGLGNIST